MQLFWSTTNLPGTSGIRLLLVLLLLSGISHGQSQSDSLWANRMFRQTSGQAILPDFLDSYGVVFRDLNRDSLADLYVVRFRELNRLFLKSGSNGLFDDRTIQSGLGGNLMPLVQENLELGASAADANNDGWLDVLVVGWGETTRLFQQEDELVFRDYTDLAANFAPISGNGGIWADIDLDGDLDLFITDEHNPNHLLLNDGSGQFTRAGADYGLDSSATKSQGAIFSDFDADGFPDLYVCNWYTPDVLYRNMGGRHFEVVNLGLLHLQASLESNGVSSGDIDNDGDLDLLVTDRDINTRLYENRTAGAVWKFLDITEESGLDNPYPAYGSIIADLNNDGWQDIFFTNIGPNVFFLGRPGKHFELAFEEKLNEKSRRRSYSTGAAVADFDLDGDLDLFIANKDTNSVFYNNPLDSETAIRLDLEGVQSNRDAIGAKVWLLHGESDRSDTLAYREISGGSGYLSISETAVHLPARPGERYRAIVRFPSGITRILPGLQAGKRYRLAETEGVQRLVLRTLQAGMRQLKERSFLPNLLMFLFLVALVAGFLTLSFRRYSWQNRHTVFFLGALLLVLYLLSLVLFRYSLSTLLLSQLAAALSIIGVTAGFMEQIRRAEHRRFGYRSLLRSFSDQLIYIKNNDELNQKLVETVRQSLDVHFCALGELQEQTVRIRARAGEAEQLPEQFELAKLLRLPDKGYYEAEEIHHLSAGLQDSAARLLLPLNSKGEAAALLLLGARADGRPFFPEDLELLLILGRQAGIAIENNRYIEESKAFIQRLTEADLREKYVAELEEKNHSLETLYRELQDTQSQLIQSEKMGSLGQLVAGIAHELNNPISFIYANMKELEKYLEAIQALLAVLNDKQRGDFPTELREQLAVLDQKYDLAYIQDDIDNLVDESLEGSQRVKDLVQSLRNFSRLDEAEFKAVDLHEGLESSLKLLNNEFRNRITVQRDYGELPAVYCNAGQLNQVFMNLLINAGQSIDGKGEIHITTRQDGDKVEIRVRDSGRGIPKAIRSKIFDPFFTTKEVGKGTGLGLSISYNIIEKHGGDIRVESEEDRGTTFIVRLPVSGEIQPVVPGGIALH